MDGWVDGAVFAHHPAKGEIACDRNEAQETPSSQKGPTQEAQPVALRRLRIGRTSLAEIEALVPVEKRSAAAWPAARYRRL